MCCDDGGWWMFDGVIEVEKGEMTFREKGW